MPESVSERDKGRMIETERLILREYTLDDLDSKYKAIRKGRSYR